MAGGRPKEYVSVVPSHASLPLAWGVLTANGYELRPGGASALGPGRSAAEPWVQGLRESRADPRVRPGGAMCSATERFGERPDASPPSWLAYYDEHAARQARLGAATSRRTTAARRLSIGFSCCTLRILVIGSDVDGAIGGFACASVSEVDARGDVGRVSRDRALCRILSVCRTCRFQGRIRTINRPVRDHSIIRTNLETNNVRQTDVFNCCFDTSQARAEKPGRRASGLGNAHQQLCLEYRWTARFC